jgi:hypothetical protein
VLSLLTSCRYCKLAELLSLFSEERLAQRIERCFKRTWISSEYVVCRCDTQSDLTRQTNLSRVSAPIIVKLEQEIALLNDMATTGVQSVSADSSQLSNIKHQPPAKQLPANVSALLNVLSSQVAAIASTRARIADLMDALAATNREALESGVRVLEQTVHGSVSRAAKARAENAGVVAKGLELKIKFVALVKCHYTDFLEYWPRQTLLSMSHN